MNEEVKNKVNEEVTEVEEMKEKESVLSKVKTELSKHGKKVAAIAAVAAVGLIGYALGSKNRNDDLESIDDERIIDVPSESSTEDTNEDA